MRNLSDWGLELFVFGLVIGYLPLAHYMHGSFEPVGGAFLKNVTLWWGCAWTLAVYVAQVGSLAMIVIGLCYSGSWLPSDPWLGKGRSMLVRIPQVGPLFGAAA